MQIVETRRKAMPATNGKILNLSGPNIQPITSPSIDEQGTANKMTLIYLGNDIAASKEHV